MKPWLWWTVTPKADLLTKSNLYEYKRFTLPFKILSGFLHNVWVDLKMIFQLNLLTHVIFFLAQVMRFCRKCFVWRWLRHEFAMMTWQKFIAWASETKENQTCNQRRKNISVHCASFSWLLHSTCFFVFDWFFILHIQLFEEVNLARAW